MKLFDCLKHYHIDCYKFITQMKDLDYIQNITTKIIASS